MLDLIIGNQYIYGTYTIADYIPFRSWTKFERKLEIFDEIGDFGWTKN